jgi:hypothetical protein
MNKIKITLQKMQGLLIILCSGFISYPHPLQLPHEPLQPPDSVPPFPMYIKPVNRCFALPLHTGHFTLSFSRKETNSLNL